MSNNSCRECMGTGGIGRLETCSECKGTGKNSDLVIENPPAAFRFKWDYDHGNGWSQGATRYVDTMEEVEHEDKSTWREVEPLYLSPPELSELQATIAKQAAEIARLKEVNNFSDAVACVFDYLKITAANTSSRDWDDQLEDLAEEVIEYAPEYKKQWKDIGRLSADLRSANADKEAYGQNAVDLRQRLDNAIEMLYETSMAHSRIERIRIS